MNINQTLKQISIIEILIISAISLAIILLADWIFNIKINDDLIYVLIIFYVIYRLRNCKKDFVFKSKNLFSKIQFKFILIIVIVNIFFSYGMLYGVDLLGFFISDSVKSMVVAYDLISTVIIAPIAEELIFRGIFLNRINKFYSTHFSIIVSSILFGILHEPGAMIAAFVFGVCMAIIYLKSNNILLAIFAHFLNNLISESIYYLDVGNFIFTNPIVIVVFTILAIVSLYLLITSFKEEWHKFE